MTSVVRLKHILKNIIFYIPMQINTWVFNVKVFEIRYTNVGFDCPFFFLRCVSIYGAATDTSNYHPLSSPLLKLDAICMALLFFHPPEHYSSGNH